MIVKELVRKRFEKGYKTYHKKALIQKEIARILVDELALSGHNQYKSVLEIGTGTGFLTQELLNRFQIDEMILNDIAQSTLHHIDSSRLLRYTFLQGDAERMKFPGLFDAVFSTSTFHWFTDLPRFFSNIRNELTDSGILGFSTFCCQNFRELKNSLNVGLDYISSENMIDMLSNNFDVLTKKEWVKEMLFENPYDVLRHLKDTGVNGLSMEFLGRQKLHEFDEFYRQNYTKENGLVSLTYNPVIIIAKKK